jgi:hypothetical protein
MTPNKRVKFARSARPTRKGEAPLLAAYARRYAPEVMKLLFPVLTALLLSGCATPDGPRIPTSWITRESSIEEIWEHYYELCLSVKEKWKSYDCHMGTGNPFKHELGQGYKVYRYRSPPDSWEEFSGAAGFVLVVNGKVIDEINTLIQ